MRPLTSSLDFISRYELNTSKFDGWMVLEDNEVFQDMRAPKIVGLPPSSTFPSFKPMVLGWSLLFLGFTLRHWRYRKNRVQMRKGMRDTYAVIGITSRMMMRTGFDRRRETFPYMRYNLKRR
ncbi:uncharacterized protein LOC110008524 isoform X2 [Amborella trichopoda]|uniref:uncharacterized protein LOC110008524 isoform X2 n=1 Tax=Amborella trichopoda TaxID=13333 RepID=UPI0009BFF1A7|nr:uncharacterized protein LOC110008524 isoform X2 [Amborella trichopoda]|eukprot:XP_020532082.1 uncharacterized protein LOC110008524 isoform X2 [Amborella trichopoda]